MIYVENQMIMETLRKVIHDDDVECLKTLFSIPQVSSLVTQDNGLLAEVIINGSIEAFDTMLPFATGINTCPGLLSVAADYGSPYQIKALVEVGADINLPDEDGISPLLRAIQMGANDNVEMFLSLGADVHFIHEGRSLLDECYIGREFRSASMLLEHGVDLVYYRDDADVVMWIDSIRK